jgi:hypothetical protein
LMRGVQALRTRRMERRGSQLRCCVTFCEETLAVVRPSSPSPGSSPIRATPRWPASSSRSTPCLRARLVHHEIPVPEHTPVQLVDRAVGFLGCRHLHEAEAPRPARELVGHDPDRLDRSSLLEELTEIVLRRLVGKVAYEELGGHRLPPDSARDKNAPGEARLPKGR